MRKLSSSVSSEVVSSVWEEGTAPPLRVCETLCVCLTKPISQTGVEYQKVQGEFRSAVSVPTGKLWISKEERSHTVSLSGWSLTFGNDCHQC